jgi:3-oxoadipate enol-lactonase
MVAQHLAATQPGRIHKLILAETAFGTRETPLERLLTTLAQPLLHLTPQRALVAMTVKRYGSLNREVAEFLRRELSAFNHRTAVRVMSAAFGFAGRAAAAEIRAPTLVLVAGENRQTHSQGRQLAQLIAGARFGVVPRAHHLLNLDNPECFNRCVRDFLVR